MPLSASSKCEAKSKC